MIVTSEVLEGLEACRESADCNMFDILCVKSWLYVRGYDQTIEWIEEDEGDYVAGIFEGFESAPEGA